LTVLFLATPPFPPDGILPQPRLLPKKLTPRTHILPDPTAFETPLLPTIITIALDESGKANLVRQEGLGGIKGISGEKVVASVWDMAETRVRELRRVLNEDEGEE
jgi:exosome complex RNA-binding protein Rrp42 (RNase PH superfamily)